MTADLALGSTTRCDTHHQPFASVEVHTDIDAVEAQWQELERHAPASGYQMRRWMRPWIETMARAHGIKPLIVAAYDADGRAVAILPLGVWRSGLVHKAAFLGGKYANLNMGLFRPGIRWTREDVAALLDRAASLSRPRIDIFNLHHQPKSLRGHANPLCSLDLLPSPSFSAIGRLQSDAHAFLAARCSPDTLKTLAKKARRLVRHFGPLRHVVADNAAEAKAILAAFERQKKLRLRTKGLPDQFTDASLMAFLTRAAIEELPRPAVELHALYAGERIVATFGGTGNAGRFGGMFISFDDDLEVARSSPGEQLLQYIVAQKCSQGFEQFDLGIGEALYKSSYCDEVEPLVDVLFATTPRGHVLRRVLVAQVRLKRFVKQTPWAWAMVQSWRRWRSRA